MGGVVLRKYRYSRSRYLYSRRNLERSPFRSENVNSLFLYMCLFWKYPIIFKRREG